MSTPLAHTASLISIMERLRDPQTGCPWDIEQDFASIAPYTIEEAYEVAEAIASGDRNALREELGDLLLQVVFHAQMAKEAGLFGFEEVAQAIGEKMIRRHPHVFGEAHISTADAQTENWERIKQAERSQKKQNASLLDDIPAALPALVRAQKLQKRAARVGFDWPDVSGVLAKVREELAEVEAAQTPEHRAEEIGDLLFAVANLARFCNVDPEEALRATNRKFIRRFQYIEQHCPTPLADTSLESMEALWNEAKRIKSPPPEGEG